MANVAAGRGIVDRTRGVMPLVARSAGALSASAVLLFALLIALNGALRTQEDIAASFSQQTSIQTAQLELERMLKWQLDEENYIRGYVITHDPAYLESYNAVSSRFVKSERIVRSVLRQQHMTDAEGALLDYDRAHEEWHKEVADPLLRHPNTAPREIDKRGKFLIDMQTGAAGSIEDSLANQNAAVRTATADQVNATLRNSVLWLIAFGLAALLFNVYRSRVTQQLEEEKLTTQTLQRAFVSEHVPLPNCEVGSAYGAASSHLAVGGDLFDVYQLSERLALVLIADVSGKGVDAAVLTAFIKFTIRGIALRRRDPGYILQEFNTAFPRTVNNPDLFVSMCVGILDTQSLRFEYANAGHEAVFVRRAAGVEQLAVTGPVLGIMEEPFDVKTVYLEDGDTIVLATDGLTEARDRKGNFLNVEGAVELIAHGAEHPQDLADNIVRRVYARGGNRMRDDLAVLAIRVHESEPQQEPQDA